MHRDHYLSRLHSLVAQAVWRMLAMMGSTWQMLATAELYLVCRKRMEHGVPCPFLRTITQKTRLKWSGSRPNTHPQKETQ